MSKRIITLGTWDGNPIEWIVLKEENSCLLLITKTKIGNRRKFSKNNNGSWECSYIRTFLNDEFFNKAFSSDEKKRIINAYISSPNGTKDNVFILDYNEAKSLINTDDEYNNRRCDANWCCWYRAPSSGNTVRIGYPNICECNPYVNQEFTIRPAMWIREK